MFRSLSRNCTPRSETLEARTLLAGQPIISEFMAKNDGFWEDGDGNAPDWIEIQNVGDATLNLSGYSLTDSADDLARWAFPPTLVEPGEYLVVFASGQENDDYVDAGGNPHTNFKLSTSGEYLALVGPDGTIHSEFGSSHADYPEQTSNISFGVAQRKLLVNGQNDASFWQPLSDEVDTIWTELHFDAAAHGFSTGQASMGFEDDPDSRRNFTGEFLTELPSGAHAIYSRVEFDLEKSAEITRLNLRLKYDNGFVAYLNGVKVAQENAPENAQWFSPAPDRSRRDRVALHFVEFDLTDHVSELVDGTNVLAIHGLNNLNDRDDMLLVPELIASINSPEALPGYMSIPTPGAENVSQASVSSGILGETQIEGEPGFYDAPFTVNITTESPDAVIRYTTDGRPPTANTGTVYTAPILIDTTTTLRAAAFREGHIPSKVASQSYLFLEEVIRQPQQQPGLPSEWLWTEDRNFYPADYGMDSRIVDDPDYRDEIIDSLKSIRTMSVVMDPDDVFGEEGMHNNTELHGRESEHPISLEILNPDGSLAVQVDAGIRIHGNFTRHYNVTMKQSFRLTFRGEYGATTLGYPLFPDSPVTTLDNIILHAGKIRDDAQLAGNSFGRATNLDMGNIDAHSTYVHLYINGLYWGLYNPFERPDGQFAETYLGGRDSDYDSILNNSEAVDGSTTRFTSVMRSISTMNTQEEYEEFQRQAHVDSLIDFLLINQYMAHNEHEFRALVKREGDADIRFLIWDTDEMPFSNVRGREDINTYFAAGVYEQITRHPELRMKYADRIHKHLFNDGALTPDAVQARWEGLTQQIRSAVVAESARWGDMRWGNAVPRRVYTRNDDFDGFGARLAEDYFPQRTEVLLDQLRNTWRVYPDVAAPEWNQIGGPVSSDFELAMTHANDAGVILYTVDGIDPRQFGGEVAESALIHDGSPLPITQTTVVKARVLQGREWSALMEGEFIVVGPESPFHLRVTEINYNPHSAALLPGTSDNTIESSQFEFIEITNTSSAPIDTSGVQLVRGAEFTFPEGSLLAAGARVLIVKDQSAFETRYGNSSTIAGEFESESLSNTRGAIDLRDADGRQISEFFYQSSLPWPQRANGGGSSLEIVDPTASPSDPSNWRSSPSFGGSPGEGAAETNRQITVSEVLSRPAAPSVDMIELRNSSSEPVDIGNWYVSNTEDNYFLHQIAPGTTVPANGYHVLQETEIGFGLDGTHGDEFHLLEADDDGNPVRFVNHVRFGPAGEGISMGPGPDEQQTWLPLAEPTLGGANSALATGAVIISEIQFAPFDPDGDRRLLRADDFEYIELHNTTDSTQDISDWRLSGAVELTLPSGTLIDVGQTLLVVAFDPNDRTKGPVFRVQYDVDASTTIIGPYSDALDDSRGVIRLERPDDAAAEAAGVTLYLYVDEVTYQATAPWPLGTTGTGSSLSRLSATSFGNFANSWRADSASPGSVDFVFRQAGDANEDGIFNQLDLVQVLQGGKYQTGQPARWREGDWNTDGVFDQLDLVESLQAGSYLG